MSFSYTPNDELAQGDLRAFERRLKEIITCYKPQERRWKCVLAIAIIFTVIGVWSWASDPEIARVSFKQSLYNHPFFTLYLAMLVVLFVYGIHEKCLASQHIANQARLVLTTYDMTCDNNGRILPLPRHLRARSSPRSSPDQWSAADSDE